MSAKFYFNDNPIKVPHIFNGGHTYILDYPCDSHSTCTFYSATLKRGVYIFEVWGAEGGFNGGLGGYSRGTITVSNPQEIYIFVGAKGSEKHMEIGLTANSFNGGGKCYSAHSSASSDSIRSCGSGGGGTDIRIGGSSLNHRVMVAGGGGGGGSAGASKFKGGNGGGTNGQDGSTSGNNGLGGTQIAGGSSAISGSFGFGGNGTSSGTCNGGGGGWFGGGASTPGSVKGGGGGSGYVLNSSSHKPENYIYEESNYFSESVVLSGNDMFPKCTLPDIHFEENGHIGNGCARITKLDDIMQFVCSEFHYEFMFSTPLIYMFLYCHN